MTHITCRLAAKNRDQLRNPTHGSRVWDILFYLTGVTCHPADVTLSPCVCADVRQQLAEQVRCLDARLDGHVTLLGDLHDFYRRRAELELEYSRGLDKLVRQVAARHKTDRLTYVVYACRRVLG